MTDAEQNLSLAEKALDNHNIPQARIYISIARKYLQEIEELK